MSGAHEKVHYHIRWSSKDDLDWERFATRAEAERRANELALTGETYVVEARGESCSQCAALTKKFSTQRPS